MKSAFFTTEHAEADGLHFITVKSNALGHRADITVYCPEIITASLPVVILLHGVYGSHWAWTFNGQTHITAARLIRERKIRPMMLVMPSDGLFADGSGYLPHHDKDYERWIVEDVPQVIREQFPFLNADFKTFIAGLSMGGFGALRLGAKYAHQFKAFSGLSSITAFEQLSLFVKDFDGLRKQVISEDRVIDWMIRNKQDLPPFRFDCGTDDPLISPNRELHRQLAAEGIPHTFQEFDGGHSWAYWTEHLTDTLLFFEKNA